MCEYFWNYSVRLRKATKKKKKFKGEYTPPPSWLRWNFAPLNTGQWFYHLIEVTWRYELKSIAVPWSIDKDITVKTEQ
jgi:hypothetical protein